MGSLPPLAPDAQAIKRGDDDDDQEIESDGAKGVLQGLKRRTNGEEDIDDAKGNTVHEEEDEWMNQSERDGCIGSDSMGVKEIEVTVRPIFDRTVANCHRQPDQQVHRCKGNSSQACVSAEVN